MGLVALGYSLVALCCGDPVALALQVLQQFTDRVDVGVNQHSHCSGPGWLQGWSVCQLCLILTSRASTPALPQLGCSVSQATMGRPVLLFHTLWWFISIHNTRAGSTVLPRRCTGSILLTAAANEGQGHTSCSYELPPLITGQFSRLLQAVKVGQDIFPLPTQPLCGWWGRGEGSALPTLTPSGPV